MDERIENDPVALEREIAEKRHDLVLSLDLLRGNIRRKIEVGRQWRDRAVLVGLIGGAVLTLFVIGVRALGRRR